MSGGRVEVCTSCERMQGDNLYRCVACGCMNFRPATKEERERYFRTSNRYANDAAEKRHP